MSIYEYKKAYYSYGKTFLHIRGLQDSGGKLTDGLIPGAKGRDEGILYLRLVK